MTNTTLFTKVASATITKTPTDGSGTGKAIVAGWDIDSDNDRFDRKAFDSVKGDVPLGYMHITNDPGAEIGTGRTRPTPAGLLYSFRINLTNPLGMATYERMLLPADDPMSLKEFSVGFAYRKEDTTRGPQGENVIMHADLKEVSAVYRGAQRTELLSIKAATTAAADPHADALRNQLRRVELGLDITPPGGPMTDRRAAVLRTKLDEMSVFLDGGQAPGAADRSRREIETMKAEAAARAVKVQQERDAFDFAQMQARATANDPDREPVSVDPRTMRLRPTKRELEREGERQAIEQAERDARDRDRATYVANREPTPEAVERSRREWNPLPPVTRPRPKEVAR